MSGDHPESPSFYPQLAYRDPAKAMEWLSSCFGFVHMNTYRDPAGVILHAEMRFGKAVLQLSTEIPKEGWRSPLDLTGTSQYVSVYLEEIEPHFQHAKAQGVKILRELGPTPWGSRKYAALDLESHYWSFDTYHPHV